MEKKEKYPYLQDKIEYCKDHFIREKLPNFVNIKKYRLLGELRDALASIDKGGQEFEVFAELKELYDNCHISLEQYKRLLELLDSYKMELFTLVCSSQKVKIYYGRGLYKLSVEEDKYKNYIAKKKKVIKHYDNKA